MEHLTDREILLEVHHDVKRLIPLVEKHEREINQGKGVVAILVVIFGWLFGTSK